MQAFSATKPCVFSRTVLFVIAEPLHGLSSRPSPAGAQTLLQAARAFIAPPSLAPRSPVLGNEKVRGRGREGSVGVWGRGVGACVSMNKKCGRKD